MSADLQELGFTETETDVAPVITADDQRRRNKVKAWVSVLALTLVGLIVAAAIAALVGLITAPEKTKEIIGSATTDVKHQIQQAAGGKPRVVLGTNGGQAEVDACPAAWTRMIAYEDDGMESPVYSAHNGCWGEGRGDVILPLGIGDKIDVVTHDGEREFKVTAMQDVPQRTTTVEDVKHLHGTLILQTCYWDDQTMKFVVLEPLT